MENKRAWIIPIGTLLIFVWVARTVVSLVAEATHAMQETTENVFAPVNQITGEFGTQVAQLLNPTPTVLPDPVTILHDIRSLARLETIQYSLEKVITVEQGQGALSILFGDRLLFVAHGIVIAGIDLDKLSPEDLRVEGGVLYVTLPPSEVFTATLDNEKSYVYDRDTGLLTHGNVNLETTARQAAEQAILEAALADGILDQARINAENFLWRLLRDLGFAEIIFELSSSGS
ncbi:MAG: DUF4230 domain-containing protein [Anaerolineae bacterium]|nr:DUF4230 domain-containing protein [Anaerolineae bacterium]